MNHTIVSREQWLDARKALLAKERAMTHELDALRAERRQLPWVRIDKPYVFEGPEGECATCSAAAASSPSIISC
jgi:predicted dithiol-disulfide oxidoreductase (DUF899 family)